MNARLVAWHLLRETRVLTRRAVVRAARDAELEPLDRALLGRILGAHLRRRAALRAIADHHAEKKLRADVLSFAHVGLAQLLFLDDVPDHAAIGETVEAARAQLGERPSAAVNALLRRVQRDIRRGTSGDPRRDVPLADIHFEKPVFADPLAHWLLWVEQALSLPVPIARRWRNRYGDEGAVRLARSSLLAPAVSLFVPARDVEEVRAGLASIAELRRGAHPRILLAPPSARNALRASAAVRDGDALLGGETAVRAAELLEARPGDRVLELRARRGAPSALLAHTGATIDVRSPADTEFETHDAAFVRPPSSETGVLAAKPAARWRFDAARTAELAAAQSAFLAQAASAVRAGGRLVYATRSVEPDENQRRVRAFLAAHPDWSLHAEIEALPAEPGSDGPVDGGYAARLVRH